VKTSKYRSFIVQIMVLLRGFGTLFPPGCDFQHPVKRVLKIVAPQAA
jgi:hypothetical protein